MRFTHTRLMSFAALIIVLALAIATTSQGQSALPAAPAAASEVQVVDKRCPRGVHSVKDYRWYANKVYKRTKVSRAAHKRLAYMLKCQHSTWAKRVVERYHKRFKRAREQRQLAARVFPVRDHLRRIARCESGGNIRAVSSNGMYYGKYQFSMSTWASVGGSGNPAAASEYEQDMRADILYRTGGPGHWPVCQSA